MRETLVIWLTIAALALVVLVGTIASLATMPPGYHEAPYVTTVP